MKMLSFKFIALTISSVLSVPLDGSKANFNSNPFIILAQSAESVNKPVQQFTTENVQIVTSATVIKETKSVVSDKNDDKTQKVKAEEPESKKTEEAVHNIKILDTSHWKVLSSFNLSSTLSVVKYRSELTGLTIVLARAESPIVNGYFCLATEAMTNDGLPHTLEHLVFLGSEDYPYKEVLDLLANRCLADRTNAWTDTDHTCYTVYTAGPSGFLQILPVYMDHILYPTLREEDYLTEVHHINGEGQDAGVVYSEMQVNIMIPSGILIMLAGVLLHLSKILF